MNKIEFVEYFIEIVYDEKPNSDERVYKVIAERLFEHNYFHSLSKMLIKQILLRACENHLSETCPSRHKFLDAYQEVMRNSPLINNKHYPENILCKCFSCNIARNWDNGKCGYYLDPKLYSSQYKDMDNCDGILDMPENHIDSDKYCSYHFHYFHPNLYTCCMQNVVKGKMVDKTK